MSWIEGKIRRCSGWDGGSLGIEYDGEVWESELLGLEVASVLIAIREHPSDSANWRHDVPERPQVLASYDDVAGWADLNCPHHEQFFLRELPSLTLLSSAGVTSIVDLSIDGALLELDTRRAAKFVAIGAPLSKLMSVLQAQPRLMMVRQYWEPRLVVRQRGREVNHLGYWHDDLGVMLSPEYTEYDSAPLQRLLASFRRRNSARARDGARAQFEQLWEQRQPEVLDPSAAPTRWPRWWPKR